MSNSQMKIRLPLSVKEFIEKEAKKNLRSMNAEIVFLIRQNMEKAAGEQIGVQAPAANNQHDVSASYQSTITEIGVPQ